MKRLLPILITMVVAYLGCSKGADAPGLQFTTVIYAYQDLPFKYSIGSIASGSYSVSSLPSWVSFDAVNGVLSGTPSKMEDGFTFSVSQDLGGGTATFGPYQVSIIGNYLKEYQWHLGNTGQTSFAGVGGTTGEDLHLSGTINSGYDGEGVNIAISDTGVVLTHEALSAHALTSLSRNYYNNYSVTHSWLGDPSPDTSVPDNAHGTAVASLAAGVGWNGAGVRGVAPRANIAGFLWLEPQTQLMGEGLYTAALNDQFEGPFDIFNYSWGDVQCTLTQYSQSTFDQMYAGATGQRGGLGSVYLIAAGNSYIDDLSNCAGTGNFYGNANASELDTTPYAMIIAATNANGVRSSYSSPGSNIWVSSTGGEFGLQDPQPGYPTANQPAMLAADFPGCNVGLKTIDAPDNAFDAGGAPNQSCMYTAGMNGTSSATPTASGSVALLLQANPALSWRDVRYILAKTADEIDPTVNPSTHPNSSLNLSGHTYEQGWITNGAGFHFQNWYGFGRINVDNAVALAKSYTFPLGPYQETDWADTSSSIMVPIPDDSATGTSVTLNVSSSLTIESVQLRVTIDHCPSDMGLELTSPAGTKSILMNINSEIVDTQISDHRFLSNAFYGENSSGTWTLKVIDGHAGCTGNLTNWMLNFAGY